MYSQPYTHIYRESMDEQLIQILQNADAPSVAFSLYILYRLEIININIKQLDSRLNCVENENSTRPTIPVPISQKDK